MPPLVPARSATETGIDPQFIDCVCVFWTEKKHPAMNGWSVENSQLSDRRRCRVFGTQSGPRPARKSAAAIALAVVQSADHAAEEESDTKLILFFGAFFSSKYPAKKWFHTGGDEGENDRGRERMREREGERYEGGEMDKRRT